MIEKENKKRVNILLEDSQRKYLQQITKKRDISASEFIRELIEEKRSAEQEDQLKKAVNDLAELYTTDQELTAFTALDSEDVG